TAARSSLRSFPRTGSPAAQGRPTGARALGQRQIASHSRSLSSSLGWIRDISETSVGRLFGLTRQQEEAPRSGRLQRVLHAGVRVRGEPEPGDVPATQIAKVVVVLEPKRPDDEAAAAMERHEAVHHEPAALAGE